MDLEPCTLKVLKALFFWEARLGSESVLGGVSPPACWPSSHLTTFPCPAHGPLGMGVSECQPGQGQQLCEPKPLAHSLLPTRGLVQLSFWNPAPRLEPPKRSGLVLILPGKPLEA